MGECWLWLWYVYVCGGCSRLAPALLRRRCLLDFFHTSRVSFENVSLLVRACFSTRVYHGVSTIRQFVQQTMPRRTRHDESSHVTFRAWAVRRVEGVMRWVGRRRRATCLCGWVRWHALELALELIENAVAVVTPTEQTTTEKSCRTSASIMDQNRKTSLAAAAAVVVKSEHHHTGRKTNDTFKWTQHFLSEKVKRTHLGFKVIFSGKKQQHKPIEQ